MPTIKSRDTGRTGYTKIWRPRGTRYANSGTVTAIDHGGRGMTATIQTAVSQGIEEALNQFKHEFNTEPRLEDLVIEVIGVTAGVSVSVLEVKD